jgi:hypothetical protein
VQVPAVVLRGIVQPPAKKIIGMTSIATIVISYK